MSKRRIMDDQLSTFDELQKTGRNIGEFSLVLQTLVGQACTATAPLLSPAPG